MKRKYLGLLLVAMAVSFTGYTAYSSHQQTNLSEVTLANLEALSAAPEVNDNPESTDCNNKNGYRKWSTTGFLEHKKEFYDCCSKLQNGYSPKDNCR